MKCQRCNITRSKLTIAQAEFARVARRMAFRDATPRLQAELERTKREVRKAQDNLNEHEAVCTDALSEPTGRVEP